MKKKGMTSSDNIIEANSYFLELAKQSGYNVRLIKSRERRAYIVNVREWIACEMYRFYTCPLIGHVMNRDHSSIRHLVEIRSKK